MQEHNKLDEINNKRPPYLWNHPDIQCEPHSYRSIAAPNECYGDGRIQKFEETVQEIANHITTHRYPTRIFPIQTAPLERAYKTVH